MGKKTATVIFLRHLMYGLEKSGRSAMGTNFLPLPSGGFIASQSKPCYTVPWLPTLIKNISGCGFGQCFYTLKKGECHLLRRLKILICLFDRFVV
jgi:hypothetical protein